MSYDRYSKLIKHAFSKQEIFKDISPTGSQ